MEEIWKPIEKTDGKYEVSNLGNVRHAVRKRNIKTWASGQYSKGGAKKLYQKIELWGYGRFTVHRLVAEAFISNPDNKPTVDHIDGDPKNNKADNLRWATMSEQMTYYYKRQKTKI